MNQTLPDAKKLHDIKKMSSCVGLLFWPGVLAVVLSCFENSLPWTFFIVLTVWIGLAMGLSGAPGLADYLLGRVPEHRQVSKAKFQVMSLITFGVPTLATGILGIVLAANLREHLQPRSQLVPSDFGFLTIGFQVFAMYFICAGICWILVGREVKLAQQQLEDREQQSTENESA